VAIAEDGTKGLEMLRDGYYDLLLIDHKMPRLSGTEVIRELKRRGPLPPILMISALGKDEVATEAFKLGAMDYILKDPGAQFLDTLPSAIEAVLSRHEETEVLRRASEDRNRWLHELKQRVKELSCLYGMEKLFATGSESLEPVFQGVANLIPRACRHDTICCARIRVRNQEYLSDNFRETQWRKSFPINELGVTVGAIDVGYRERPPGFEHEIFSPEEQELLHAISDRLSQFIDRWRTQAQLRQIHDEIRKLSRAVEQSASAVVITDSKGNIEYVNPKFTQMTGYKADEVLSKNTRILKSGERGPEEYKKLWETITSGHEWRGEFHNRKKNGELYWDFSSISPVTSTEGVVTHFVAVKEDITDRKLQEGLLNAVLMLSAEIAGCETEDAICRVVVEGIRNKMKIDRCGLFLGDPNNPPFRGTYGTDLHGRTTHEHNIAWHIARERDVSDLFKSGSYQTGFPLGSPDTQPGEEGIYSTLIALRQGGTGHIFGVISVDNRITRRPVSEAQMMHIALLAEVLGNALQVARARGALRSAVEDAKRANEDLEGFNRAMVGREGRVIELKEEVNQLLAELGRPPQYPPVWNEAEEHSSKTP
jgi:PAS domain S-box-containing protein